MSTCQRIRDAQNLEEARDIVRDAMTPSLITCPVDTWFGRKCLGESGWTQIKAKEETENEAFAVIQSIAEDIRQAVKQLKPDAKLTTVIRNDPNQRSDCIAEKPPILYNETFNDIRMDISDVAMIVEVKLNGTDGKERYNNEYKLLTCDGATELLFNPVAAFSSVLTGHPIWDKKVFREDAYQKFSDVLTEVRTKLPNPLKVHRVDTSRKKRPRTVTVKQPSPTLKKSKGSAQGNQ
ncbi:hypothetical protein SERLA73DRAFT_71437 [Serpula lacrymans var. lacrymans S7.3]|uniref:Uncharacterized protein n=1 Tax=Serpula lacrymans var. lacrymans (strain S7.3) TaxID=936435 RepID=F8PQV1_SERL3|nr:hypothetical protein SERLA73DRAFT_71437 [Serpula lacrymans var. lacrymans S7.3]